MKTVYKSKIGIELILIFAATFGSIGVVMATAAEYDQLLINVLLLVAIAYVFWKTEYIISAHILNVKFSLFFNEQINIASIRKIKEIESFKRSSSFYRSVGNFL